MGFAELFLIAFGLSMDAFAVSVCKGLAAGKADIGRMLIAGIWFGVFQMLMPIIGYFLGTGFSSMIQNIDHWIAFILLAIIGGNMIREALAEESGEESSSYSIRAMLPLAVATSIDALAVGISFAFLSVDIIPAAITIGICTFVLSMAGIRIGAAAGDRFRSKAEMLGGVILILMGLKILLEHLGIL